MAPVAGQAVWLKVPNLLTLLRILMVPVFVGIYFLPHNWSPMVAAGIFALAGLTDWLDGYLARKMEQTSKLGAFLDPVADKLMVVAALVVLVSSYNSFAMVIPAIVIISREIAVSALREWMAEIGKRAHVAVSHIGKIKTSFQMIAITVLLALPQGSANELVWLGYLLLFTATGLTLWSMTQYLKAAWPDLLN